MNAMINNYFTSIYLSTYISVFVFLSSLASIKIYIGMYEKKKRREQKKDRHRRSLNNFTLENHPVFLPQDDYDL